MKPQNPRQWMWQNMTFILHNPGSQRNQLCMFAGTPEATFDLPSIDAYSKWMIQISPSRSPFVLIPPQSTTSLLFARTFQQKELRGPGWTFPSGSDRSSGGATSTSAQLKVPGS